MFRNLDVNEPGSRCALFISRAYSVFACKAQGVSSSSVQRVGVSSEKDRAFSQGVVKASVSLAQYEEVCCVLRSFVFSSRWNELPLLSKPKPLISKWDLRSPSLAFKSYLSLREVGL